ncbi:MAG: flagellar hook-basal body complex protein FliE [Treponema sp.]|jgi:flagellar hook-basal body complex protein FliE|nr:flagellar hook-basal body complex protein FliE [Treponema sp.]
MTIYRPELAGLGSLPDLPLKITHPYHMVSGTEDFLAEGRKISELGGKIGAEAVVRSGTFEDAMLGALDKVSAYQQFSSQLAQAAITDPDSVDIQDITIAQAEAGMSLNIAINVLNRIVQGWKDLINTR